MEYLLLKHLLEVSVKGTVKWLRDEDIGVLGYEQRKMPKEEGEASFKSFYI
jgi:hypothetical protein